jgi:hypothetical protein
MSEQIEIETDKTKDISIVNGADKSVVATAVYEPKLGNTEYTMSDVQRIGRMFSSSGMFSDAREVAQACVKILAGAEYGIAPVTSMMGIYTVLGKLFFGYQLLEQIANRGGFVLNVLSIDDKACTIEVLKKRKKLGEVTFTIEDANKAGLVKAGSGWAKNPKNMLYARAVSNACRWYCSSAFGGYVPLSDGDVDQIEETNNDDLRKLKDEATKA